MTLNFDIIQRGAGEPLVLVPGVQGRWEYSRGLVDALARHYRVLTFSLADERAGRPAARGTIDVFADQVESALDRCSLRAAIVVGVSFGGLVSLRFAATRAARTRALVMVSAPGPQWHLRPRHDAYARLPWLFGPLFVVESPFRLRREIDTALPAWSDRRRYLIEQARTIVSAPVSLSRMAARARLIHRYDRVTDCGLVTAPTLVVQGEDALDHVTGSGGTDEYVRLIRDARHARMHETGHLGSVTRPDACADIIHRFIVETTAKDSEHSAA